MQDYNLKLYIRKKYLLLKTIYLLKKTEYKSGFFFNL